MPDVPVTQKQMVELQLEITKDMFGLVAELKQDITELKTDIAEIKGTKIADTVAASHRHNTRAELIWTVGIAVNFILGLSALLASVHVL